MLDDGILDKQMSYACPICRDTKRITHTFRTEYFGPEHRMTEICRCDTSMTDYELALITGEMDASCLSNTPEENAELLERLFDGKCQTTKLEYGRRYGVPVREKA